MLEFSKNLKFTPEDIKEVEKCFFPYGTTFNKEQVKVIGCFSKENIQACPGSGKTTSLAAKLLLLKKYLPPDIQGGISILTHTNVAIEIIKQRLGHEATAFYTNYPNYLGTIQTFVNRFLVTPAYKQIFKKPIQAIDDDLYIIIMDKRQVKANTALTYLSRNKRIDDLWVLSYNIHDFAISQHCSDLEPIVSVDTASYKQIEGIKAGMLEDGYMKYDEAYSIAFRYLRDFPAVEKLFAKRFPIVFLDEMQDTESHQFDLLNKLFGTDSILQTIGDINQDIFGNYEHIIKDYPPSANFSIATCSRFPQHMATFVQQVGVEPQYLIGHPAENPINPHIFVFEDNSIHLVKDYFGNLITEKGLQHVVEPKFKAIGARKNDGKIHIASYFPEFNKSTQKIRERYPSMDDYLEVTSEISKITKNVRPVKDIVVSLITEMLRINGVINPSTSRPYSARTFDFFLRGTNEKMYSDYRDNLVQWVSTIRSGKEVKKPIARFVRDLIVIVFGLNLEQSVIDFFKAKSSRQSENNTLKDNKYLYKKDDTLVEIEFDTVHGVKGETHTATLYLETYNRCYDLEKILPLISGVQRRSPSYIETNKQRLKQAYVGFSRPTHLICLAVHCERIDLNLDWASKGITIVKVKAPLS